MFDFGLSMGELMVIAVIALIVVGPKDLPKMLRTIAKFVTRLRGMAGEFQRHLDAAIRESGIDEVKKEVRNMTNFTVTADVGKKMSEEFKRQGDEIKTMLESPEKPTEKKAPELAEPAAQTPAEPAILSTEETKAKVS
jgi:sec-independent protein translocase protein TatB